MSCALDEVKFFFCKFIELICKMNGDTEIKYSHVPQITFETTCMMVVL